MSAYVEPIKQAVVFFPFIAMLFTFPYMVWQYRKYGSILVLRTVVVYSFILYMMCAYFLTILPLPSIDSVAKLTTPTMQLVPFRELVDFFQKSGLNLAQPATYLTAIKSHNFICISMNILMLLPFGIYMRYYFRRRLWQTVLLALGVSLVFELTQLSGLFFIYPRPYRLCDVDDLITNTLGGYLGYLVAPLFMRALPSAERLDAVAYKRGTHVSVVRRLACLAVDYFVVFLAFILLLSVCPAILEPLKRLPGVLQYTPLMFAFLLVVLLYFAVVQWLFRGRTVGKWAFGIKLCAKGGGRPKLWQCLVRTAVLHTGLLLVPVCSFLMLFAKADGIGANAERVIMFLVLNGVIWLAFAIALLRHIVDHARPLPHDWLARTRLMSTTVMTPEMMLDAGIDPAHMGDVAAPEPPEQEETQYLN